MNVEQSTVLVTGAAGFIGSHLVELLAQKGCRVRAFVRYNSRAAAGWLADVPAALQSNIETVFGDLRDPISVRNAMVGCDVVFHLGALIGIPYSYEAPDAYVDVNVTGSLNVLQSARELGVKRVVLTSTSEVYGTARFVPITEEHPLQAQSPYAATKTAADQLALSFHAAFGTAVSIARPFNTYGPRQSARAVIPTVITQIASGQRVLQLGSLHPTRDFNFVADTIAGMVAIAESEATIGEVINLGSNFEVSIADAVKTIARIMGAEVKIEADAQRVRPDRSEVDRLWADASKATRLTGWTPAYAAQEGFERGLKATIAWFTHPDHLKLYRAEQYNV